MTETKFAQLLGDEVAAVSETNVSLDVVVLYDEDRQLLTIHDLPAQAVSCLEEGQYFYVPSTKEVGIPVKLQHRLFPGDEIKKYFDILKSKSKDIRHKAGLKMLHTPVMSFNMIGKLMPISLEEVEDVD